MRSVILIASVFAIVSASNRSFLRQEEPKEFKGNETFSPIRMIKGMSNFYQGYVEGLTKQKSMKGQCFDENTMNNAFKLIEEIQTGDQSKLFQALPQILQIITSFSECNMSNPIMEKMMHCFNAQVPEPSCEFGHVTENISKNMFVIMGKFTDITTLISTFPATQETEFLEQCQQIGLDFGTILRVLLQ